MTRITQKYNGHGSLKDIQILINKNQNLIDKKIKNTIKELSNDSIIWSSPLENDDFAEYRDEDFLKKIGINPMEIQLENFWPIRGPQWDALATTISKKIILVEAKANIPEIISPASGAKGISKTLINKSLNETKIYLNVTNDIDWSGKFYQYTNRLAHLYFLRKKCNKDVFLINIYFIGDKSVKGPETIDEWKGAINVLNSFLGIKKHKLKKYMADIFIDINDLQK